jgi:hypothetical protein
LANLAVFFVSYVPSDYLIPLISHTPPAACREQGAGRYVG